MSENQTTRTVSTGTVALLTFSGLVLGLILSCLGAWVFFGPVNYFGCGLSRPAGITAADLVGTYASPDGGRIELSADGTLIATDIPNPMTDTDVTATNLGVAAVTVPIGGPGTWQLRSSESGFGDVNVEFTSPPPEYGPGIVGAEFDLAGSRKRPVLYSYTGDPDSCHIYRMNRV